jgi:hypothetical protein
VAGGSSGGYTKNHARFQEQSNNWAHKASAGGNMKDVVAVKVAMGTIKPGQNRVAQIGVSI